ncbi:hypothetical protein IL306_012535, partial [Fusarium sp. DS 682]
APEQGSHRRGGNVFRSHEVIENGEGGGKADHVAENVDVALEGGSLEAVLWDGIADVLNGEVRGHELVAICIKETAMRKLSLVGIHRRERRKGGRGLRVSDGVPKRWVLPGDSGGRDGSHYREDRLL